MDMSAEEKLRTIRTLLLDHADRLPQAQVNYISWLVKQRVKKDRTSVVVEFTHPEDANTAIDHGLQWDGEPHQVEAYAGGGRIQQCLRCQQYGHIGTRCRAPVKCARCAESRDTKACLEDPSLPFKCTL